MLKSRKVLRGFATGILLICTVYLVYSIISNPFGVQEQDIMFALAVAAGFISLGSNKNKSKDE